MGLSTEAVLADPSIVLHRTFHCPEHHATSSHVGVLEVTSRSLSSSSSPFFASRGDQGKRRSFQGKLYAD